MSSPFKLNQLSIQPEITGPINGEIPQTTLEGQNKEIHALREQLQTLKALYKNIKEECQKEREAKLLALEEIDALRQQLHIVKILSQKEKKLQTKDAQIFEGV